MAIFPGSAIPSAAADAYTIDNSLRLDTTSFLSRTPDSAGNRKIWTLSFWTKRGKIGGEQHFLQAPTSGAQPYTDLLWDSSTNKIHFYDYSGGYSFNLKTLPIYRDPSAWYHIVIKYDSTPATPGSNDVGIYVNGEQVTAFTTETYPAQDYETGMNKALEFPWGSNGAVAGIDGYIAETYFIDGTKLAASDFGELDSTTNQWIPLDGDDVKDAVTFGTNGFYQKYGGTELANSFTDSGGYGFLPTESLTCNVLVVAAGGGGGPGDGDSSVGAGGGGAGGYRTATGFSVTAQPYAVTVGAGGVGRSSGAEVQGGDGGNSIFSTITSTGGGGGGSRKYPPQSPHTEEEGRDGGSGGGIGGHTDVPGTGNTPSTSPSQGYDGGGNSSPNGDGGAGGGGAGAVGSDKVASSTTGGAGGVGLSNSITGSAVFYAGGGGGGSGSAGTGGAGGNGGGGAGGSADAGVAGTANTGGGGGGGANAAASGAGGSGVVIISYISTTEKATGGTITSYVDGSDTYQVHTFTSSDEPHTITPEGDVTNTRAVRKIGDSSIKFDGSGDYLSTPNSSDFNFGSGDFTMEAWIYPTDASLNEQTIFSKRIGSDFEYILNFATSGGDGYSQVGFLYSTDGSSWASTTRFSSGITVNSWQHFAVVRSGTTITLYVDGSSIGSLTGVGTLYSSSEDFLSGYYGSGGYFRGYMDEIRISDSARYTEDFAPVPTTAFTADANTKLLIHSNWDGGLGADSSGNYNTFTPTNLVATDQVLDSPTNNFCTLNPLNAGDNGSWNGSLQEGNLKISGSAGVVKITSTFALDNVNGSYWEVRWGASTDANCGIGLIGNANLTTSSQVGADPAYKESGYKGSTGVLATDGSTEATYATSAEGTIVAFAYKAGRLYVGQVASGSAVPTWFNSGDPAAGTGYVNGSVKTDPTEWDAVIGRSHTVNFGQDSSFAGEETAQGNADANDVGDFYGTVPVGFLALCTDNLSADLDITLPGENFETVLFTGTGATRTVATSFQSDFAWFKQRDAATGHLLYNTITGGTNALASNTTAAEAQHGDAVLTFNSANIQIAGTDTGGLNGDANSMVLWNWKAGGAPTEDNVAGVGEIPTADSVKIDGSNLGSALAGTIAATRLSANTTAGMSVVSYTGTGSLATVGHGLGVAPELVIIKDRTTASTNWSVGTTAGVDFTYVAYLNATNAFATDSAYFNNADPSDTVFTINTNNYVNDTDDYVAYCFASIEGYSKVGSYEGNADADGTFIYLGFKPEFFLVKDIDAVESWAMWDGTREPYNKLSKKISPDSNVAEYTANTTTYAIDFLSNGVKLRSSYSVLNASESYLYYAVAESPFKYSNAR